MPNFCIIVNNKITNVIAADSLADLPVSNGAEIKLQDSDFPYGPNWEFNGTIWFDPTLVEEE